MTKDFDLQEVLGGTVSSVTEKFGDMSDDQLAKLHDLEKAGAKRTTLLDDIHREQKSREQAKQQGDDAMTGAPNGDAAGGVDDGAHTGTAQSNDTAASEGSAMYSQEQVDALLAEQAQRHEVDKSVAVANASKGARAPKVAATPKLKPLSIGADADNVSMAALTGGTQVMFVDDHDTPLPGLAGTPFQPADYEPRGETVTLKRDVDFPRELPRAEISGAFLLDDDGDPVGKAVLVQPFAIGGGRGAKLGANTLQFAGRAAA